MCLLLFQAKHTQEGNTSWGVNGETGTLADMEQLGIWEPLAVKAQTYKTAVEVGNVFGDHHNLIRKQSIQFCVIQKGAIHRDGDCFGKRITAFFPSCLDGCPVTAH